MTGQPPVLWDVVEEHLDEAEFLLEQWLAATHSPRFSLTSLKRTLEPRLVAHLDALVVGGTPVAERLLSPALEDDAGLGPTRVAAAALALLLEGDAVTRDRLIEQLRTTDQPPVREGLSLAFALIARSDVDEPLRLALYSCDRPAPQAALLDLLAARRIDPGPVLAVLLEHDDAAVRKAALSAAAAAPPHHLQHLVEQQLLSEEPAVRAAALRTALFWNLASGWRRCATDAAQGAPEAMAFVASLGGDDALAGLISATQSAEQRHAALFALGLSGRTEAVDACLPFLDDEDKRTARLAGEAIAAITDLPLDDQPFAAPAADDGDNPGGDGGDSDGEAPDQRALPPLAEDLTADLSPDPVDELPLPAAPAIRAWWSDRRPSYAPHRRYLRGQPLSLPSLRSALSEAPLRRRGPLAWEIAIRSEGRLLFPPPRLGHAAPDLPADLPLHRPPPWR